MPFYKKKGQEPTVLQEENRVSSAADKGKNREDSHYGKIPGRDIELTLRALESVNNMVESIMEKKEANALLKKHSLQCAVVEDTGETGNNWKSGGKDAQEITLPQLSKELSKHPLRGEKQGRSRQSVSFYQGSLRLKS